MSVKLFIETRQIPRFPKSVKEFQIDEYPKNPLLYEYPFEGLDAIPIRDELKTKDPHWWYFEDITGEQGTIPIVTGWAGANSTIKDILYSGDKAPIKLYALLKKISEKTDQEIEDHLTNLFYRPTMYWDRWYEITLPFLKANRDYLKSLFDADVIDIVYVERTK